MDFQPNIPAIDVILSIIPQARRRDIEDATTFYEEAQNYKRGMEIAQFRLENFTKGILGYGGLNAIATKMEVARCQYDMTLSLEKCARVISYAIGEEFQFAPVIERDKQILQGYRALILGSSYESSEAEPSYYEEYTPDTFNYQPSSSEDDSESTAC